MSLINDALKKAQKQRTGEAPMLASLPGVGGESATRIARRSKSGGPDPRLIWAGAGAGVLLFAGGWFAFRPSPAANRLAANPASVTQSSSPASPVAKPQDEPRPGSKSDGGSAPVTFVLPVAPAPKVENVAPVQKAEPREPRVPAAQTQSSSPVAKPQDEPRRSSESEGGPPAKPAAALKLEPRAIQFIDNIKVAGIRASATDAKVLMNDRVYRVGSQVDADLGLKLVGITANSLTFEDERGARYTRML